MSSDVIFGLAILIPSVAAHLLLGSVVFVNNPRSATNRLFFLLSALIILWAVTNHISLHPPTADAALFWIRLVMFFAAPLSMTLFLFIYTFPQTSIPLGRAPLFFLGGVTLATMVVALSPFLFTRLDVSAEGAFQPQPGPGMILFVLVGIGSIIAAIVFLIRKFLSATGALRAQLRDLLIGIVIFWGLVIGTIFIPVVFFRFSGFVPFSPAWSLAFSGATAYAIVQHRLLNIRIAYVAALITVLMLLLLFRLFLSSGSQDLALNGILFVGTAVIGYFLTRSMVRDIHRREQVETLFHGLEKSFTSLKKTDETKTEFLSIASHQLRAPMTAMKGFLSMLKEGDFGSVTTEQQGVLEKVMQAENRLMKLVEDYLNFSRIEAGHAQLNLAAVAIGDLVAGVVDELRPLAIEKNIQFTFNRSPESAVISADSDKLRQVFLNLIENAIKYTDKGEVAVSLVTQPDEVIVTVHDTGRGITEEEQKSMFQKFARGIDAIKHSTGTGLGLYIANEFVKAHGGHITVESLGTGKGSTFSIILPIKTPAKTPATGGG